MCLILSVNLTLMNSLLVKCAIKIYIFMFHIIKQIYLFIVISVREYFARGWCNMLLTNIDLSNAFIVLTLSMIMIALTFN